MDAGAIMQFDSSDTGRPVGARKRAQRLSLLLCVVSFALATVVAPQVTADESPAAATAETDSSSDEGSANSTPPTATTAEAPSASEGEGASTSDTQTSAAESADEAKTDSAEEEQPVEPPPFKHQPYSVRVEIGFAHTCLPDAAQRERVVRGVRNAIARMYGRMWEVEVGENSWMVPASRRRLEWLDESELLERYPEQVVQKVFVVTVEDRGSAYLLSCREYDSRIQELTPVLSRDSHDVRAVPAVATELLRDSFRPCVLYERKYVDDDGRQIMEMQVQAGEIIPPDPSAEQVVENDVLRPFVRQMDRRNPNRMTRLLRLDLSYVRVLSVDRGEASDSSGRSTEEETVAVPVTESTGEATEGRGGYSPGRIQGFFISHSPYSPFGSKGRRVQHLAVRQRPSAPTSKVRIILRNRPDRPLVSHRLALAYQLNWDDPEDGPQTRLVSDRNGEVVIEQKEGHPTFWIRVYSGTSLLARVPYAPGLIPSDTIELPDDSIRLSVEGEIQLLSDEVIDSIALQAVLLARARKAAEVGDVDQFEALIERRSRVPGREYFLEKVNNIWIPARNRLQERKLSIRRTKMLCDNLKDSIERFFSETARQEQERTIAGLRAQAAQNSARN